MRSRSWLALLVVGVLSTVGATAHAESIFGPPDYIHAVWLRVGYTSEGHFSFGVSGDIIPLSVTIEISPHSELGLLRAVAGFKSTTAVPTTCSPFVAFGAGVATAFGPHQDPHVGLRLGANLQAMSMTDMAPGRYAEALSYNFTWFGAGHFHDGGLAFGLFDAPHASCRGD